MSKTLPSTDGCKGAFSRPSHVKGLSCATSHSASTRLLVSSWPKALLAFGFFALTNFVIFEDVLRHGAVITTDHLLSFAVLVGTFAAGHFFCPTWTQREFGAAAGLALLCTAGSVYCVLTSAGRNAEALANKAAKVTEANGEYAKLEGEVRSAKSDMVDAKGKVGTAETDAKAATDKSDTACRKHGDESWRCETERKNAGAAESRRAKAQTTYEEKKGRFFVKDAELSVATKKATNVDLKYAAKVLGYFGATVTEEQLADIVPFIKGVFCEFATLLFAAGAFGHRRETVSQGTPSATVSVRPSHAASESSRDRPTATVLRLRTSHGASSLARTVPQTQAAALVLLRQHLAVHGTVLQDDLAALFGGLSKQTVSRWCVEWQAEGHIVRTISGRTRTVSLNRGRAWSRTKDRLCRERLA